jgi:DNA-binding FadR family transcriptional regulator
MDSLKIKDEPTTLVDLAEKSLLKYIKKQNLKPGDKLLHEDELAEKLGVGRNVVREALSRLRFLGILDTRKRRGIVLQEPDIRKNLEKLINPQMLSLDTIINLLELRYTLEIGIIPTLLDRVTSQDVIDLEDILLNETYREDVRVAINDELLFHTRMYEIIGNQTILDLQQLLVPMYRFVDENYHEFEIFNKKIREKNIKASHKDIVECLKKKDKDEYEDVIKRHLMPYYLYIKEYRNNQTQLIINNI